MLGFFFFFKSAGPGVTRCHVCDSVSKPPPASRPVPCGRISCLLLSALCLHSRSFRSHLWALCAAAFFVSASPATGLSLPSLCSLPQCQEAIGLKGIDISGVWGCGGSGVRVGGLPAFPALTPIMPSYDSDHPLPKAIIHIYEI